MKYKGTRILRQQYTWLTKPENESIFSAARGVWSLWEMIKHYETFVAEIFRQFATTIQGLLQSDDPKAELSKSYTDGISRLFAFTIIERHENVFLDDNLSSRLWTLKTQLAGGERFTGEMLARELQGLEGQMIQALGKRKFAYIPPPNDKYFERDELFGKEVFEAFGKAQADIKDAGNSFAASLYTACVFHLMRASEHGLRALARKLKVKISHKHQLIPLEYGEWDKIITAITAKIGAARNSANTPKRAHLLEIYSDANQHCLFMKDIWRNTASHARKAYTHNEALAAMERVRDFFQFLARGMK